MRENTQGDLFHNPHQFLENKANELNGLGEALDVWEGSVTLLVAGSWGKVRRRQSKYEK